MARVGGLGLSGLLLLASVAAGGYWFGKRSLPPPVPPTETRDVLADGQTVITAVRQLARIETVSFHMERIINLKNRQSRFFGLVQADDAILLVAAGDVIAGVDLAGPQPVDVTVEPERRRAVLLLPPPILLSSRLDNEGTYVYSRKTELLAGRAEQLETRARQLAEDEIRRAALAAGILDRARQGAEASLQALVLSLGFDEVEVRFQAPQAE